MYERLLVAVDNSRAARKAAVTAVDLARALDARVRGIHVTNAALHTHAFKMLEGTLPRKYQEEEVLQEQRDIHGSLIEHGLNLISDSYLEPLRAQAREADVECDTKVLEGRHFEMLTEKIQENGCDLAVFGDVGQGSDGNGDGPGPLGSVLERTARRIRKDLLVVRTPGSAAPLGLSDDSMILVGVDGSEESLRALRRGIVLAKRFGASLRAVHVYDPEFHRRVFQEMTGVLTKEAADVFDFEGQQELHDTVIDAGLECVGRRHLKGCERAAEGAGLAITTGLLKGRFTDSLVGEAERAGADLLLLGRFGRHRVASLDMGSVAEGVLRRAPCSVMVVNSDVPEAMKHLASPAAAEEREPLEWTDDASAMITRAPEFVRKMASSAIEDWARGRKLERVDGETVAEAMKDLLPESMWRKLNPEENR